MFSWLLCLDDCADDLIVQPIVGFGISHSWFENAAMANPMHRPEYTLFREMLTAARIDKGMLQSEVAEALDKNQSYVSKYERGERRLDFVEFLEVAAALNVNVSEFLKHYSKAREKLQKSGASSKGIVSA